MNPKRCTDLMAAYRLLQECCRSPVASRRIGHGLFECCASGAIRWIFVPAQGDATDGAAIVLGVSDDLPRGALPRFFPAMRGSEGVPLRLVRSPICVADSGGQAYPIRNLSRGVEPGSVGAFSQDAATHSRYFALTAAHVAAGSASASIHDTIELTGPRSVRGKLHDWYPVMGSPEVGTSIDSALVSLAADDARALIRDPASLPTGLGELTQLGSPVTLRGTNGVLSGRFKGYWSGWVDARVTMDGRDYWLQDGVTYELAPASRGGDSGAGVWDSRERLVAFHCGSAPESTSGWNGIGCGALDVFDHFRIELLARSANLSAPPLLSSSVRVPKVAARALRAPEPSVTPSTGQPNASREVDILARTLWGEARGERDPGKSMAAVASVVLNRVRRQTYWGKSIIEVCQKPWQFSCWNLNDPNLRKLQQVSASNAVFALALSIASEAANNRLADATKGATHYYARTLGRPPRWAVGKTPCEKIDGHLFFNDVA
jgi:hypothetical protein